MGMFRRTPPPSEAQVASSHVQEAYELLQTAREKMETMEAMAWGLAAYASQSEEWAVRNGLPVAPAFRAIGLAQQGIGTGITRLALAPPTVDPRVLAAMNQMFGLPEPKTVEADEPERATNGTR